MIRYGDIAEMLSLLQKHLSFAHKGAFLCGHAGTLVCIGTVTAQLKSSAAALVGYFIKLFDFTQQHEHVHANHVIAIQLKKHA